MLDSEAEKLAENLRGLYTEAPKGEKTAFIILFGIIFSEDLDNCGASIEDICNKAFEDVPTVKRGSYISEVNQGKTLSKYVRFKDEYNSLLD